MPILKANQRKLAAAQAEARANTFEGWLAKHADHGAGPQKHAKIHVYEQWACSCGARATLSDSGEFKERAA